MVDERRVRRLLQQVRDDLFYLSEKAGMNREILVDDGDQLRAIKYVFVTAIEGCVNVAQHLCASEGWGPPSSNPDALRVLGRHRVIESDRAEAMARAASFRNVLVHGYAAVDDALVVAFLDQVSELDGYVAEVASWVKRQPGDEA